MLPLMLMLVGKALEETLLTTRNGINAVFKLFFHLNRELILINSNRIMPDAREMSIITSKIKTHSYLVGNM